MFSSALNPPVRPGILYSTISSQSKDHFSKNKNQILESKYRDVKDGANRRFSYTDPGKKNSQSEFSIAGKDIYTCTEKVEPGKQPDYQKP